MTDMLIYVDMVILTEMIIKVDMVNKLQDCQGLDGLFRLFQKQTITYVI